MFKVLNLKFDLWSYWKRNDPRARKTNDFEQVTPPNTRFEVELLHILTKGEHILYIYMYIYTRLWLETPHLDVAIPSSFAMLVYQRVFP